MSHPPPARPSPIVDALRRRVGSRLEACAHSTEPGGRGARTRQPLFVEFQFDGSPPLRGAGSSDGASIGLSELGPRTRIELDHGAALESVDATAAAGLRDGLGRRLDAAIIHAVPSMGSCVGLQRASANATLPHSLALGRSCRLSPAFSMEQTLDRLPVSGHSNAPTITDRTR